MGCGMNVSKHARRLVVAACIALMCTALFLMGCAQASSGSSSASASSASASASSADVSVGKKAQAEGPYATGTHHAELTVEGYDPITIELDADAAPASVANFCALAESGYYDGLTFYRFVKGFCMQGGTMGNTSSGHDSSLTPIVGEFSQNGYDNELADNFVKGTVAMARSSNPDGATSTFFVTLDSSEMVSLSLNGQYAAFGMIDDAGMAVVDQIVADYLPNVSDSASGVIGDESKQAKIASIKVVD